MALPGRLKKYVIAAALVLLTIVVVVYVRTRRSSMPAEFALPVPFTTQAPDGKWDNNENCEEASAIMANAYLNGKTEATLSPSEVQDSINTLLSWEDANLGHNADTGSYETSKMIEAVFHLRTKIINNFTEQDLKRELLDKRLILLPINAQGLNHPNYRQANVLYHMVVIVGYNQQGFVVHDPGTEDGRGNIYAFDKLFKPAADWDNAANKLAPDKKTALVVWK